MVELGKFHLFKMLIGTIIPLSWKKFKKKLNKNFTHKIKSKKKTGGLNFVCGSYPLNYSFIKLLLTDVSNISFNDYWFEPIP